MSSPNTVLQFPCPLCEYPYATLTILSVTVLTVTCGLCAHMWSTDLEAVPPQVRRAAEVADRDTNRASDRTGH
jgi:hypothetical protein